MNLGITVRKASELYRVPKYTLYDRVKGTVQHGKMPDE